MTGAIASVKSEDLTRTSVGSVANILGGQMTGLTTVQYSGEPVRMLLISLSAVRLRGRMLLH